MRPSKTSDYDELTIAVEWALRVSVALVFALTGLDKFSPSPYWSRLFTAIGLGEWFQYVTGGVEVFGGLLFPVPPATVVGACLLVATILGAVAVHIAVLRHPADSLFPGLYLAGVIVAFLKIRATRRAALADRQALQP